MMSGEGGGAGQVVLFASWHQEGKEVDGLSGGDMEKSDEKSEDVEEGEGREGGHVSKRARSEELGDPGEVPEKKIRQEEKEVEADPNVVWEEVSIEGTEVGDSDTEDLTASIGACIEACMDKEEASLSQGHSDKLGEEIGKDDEQDLIALPVLDVQREIEDMEAGGRGFHLPVEEQLCRQPGNQGDGIPGMGNHADTQHNDDTMTYKETKVGNHAGPELKDEELTEKEQNKNDELMVKEKDKEEKLEDKIENEELAQTYKEKSEEVVEKENSISLQNSPETSSQDHDTVTFDTKIKEPGMNTQINENGLEVITTNRSINLDEAIRLESIINHCDFNWKNRRVIVKVKSMFISIMEKLKGSQLEPDLKSGLKKAAEIFTNKARKVVLGGEMDFREKEKEWLESYVIDLKGADLKVKGALNKSDTPKVLKYNASTPGSDEVSDIKAPSMNVSTSGDQVSLTESSKKKQRRRRRGVEMALSVDTVEGQEKLPSKRLRTRQRNEPVSTQRTDAPKTPQPESMGKVLEIEDSNITPENLNLYYEQSCKFYNTNEKPKEYKVSREQFEDKESTTKQLKVLQSRHEQTKDGELNPEQLKTPGSRHDQPRIVLSLKFSNVTSEMLDLNQEQSTQVNHTHEQTKDHKEPFNDADSSIDQLKVDKSRNEQPKDAKSNKEQFRVCESINVQPMDSESCIELLEVSESTKEQPIMCETSRKQLKASESSAEQCMDLESSIDQTETIQFSTEPTKDPQLITEQTKNINLITEPSEDCQLTPDHTEDLQLISVQTVDQQLFTEQTQDPQMITDQDQTKDCQLISDQIKDCQSITEQTKDCQSITEQTKDNDSITDQTEDFESLTDLSRPGGLRKCDVRVARLSRWEVLHGRERRERGVGRRELDTVLRRMYGDREGHLWSRVEKEGGQGVDQESSVVADLIEQHVRDCGSCRRNPAFDCSGEVTSKQQLEAKVKLLEEKLAELTAKMSLLEESEGQEGGEVDAQLLSGVTRPSLSSRQTEYFSGQGYRLVDMAVARGALTTAQQCGHSNLSLAEVSPLRCQKDLASQFAFLCLTCGAQTIFCSSSFSTSDPPNFSVNKRLLPRLGARAYYSLSSLLQFTGGASDLVKVPGGQKARLLLRLDRRGEQKQAGKVPAQEQATFLPKITECKSLQSHGHPRDQGVARISNDLADYVRVRCQLCQADYPLTRLRGHTRYTHNMSITDYKSRYTTDILEVVQHKCGICGELVLLDADTIKSHLKKRGHPGVSVREYYSSYMVDSRVTVTPAQQSSWDYNPEEGEREALEASDADEPEDPDGIVIPLHSGEYADIAEEDGAGLEECKAEDVECAPDVVEREEGEIEGMEEAQNQGDSLVPNMGNEEITLDDPVEVDNDSNSTGTDPSLPFSVQEVEGKLFYKCDYKQHETDKGLHLIPLKCERVFDQLANLRKHQRCHATGAEQKAKKKQVYKCDYRSDKTDYKCEEVFKKLTSLREHERTHSGERPYKCRLCPSTFFLSWFLTRHMRAEHSSHPMEDGGQDGSQESVKDDTMQVRVDKEENESVQRSIRLDDKEAGEMNKETSWEESEPIKLRLASKVQESSDGLIDEGSKAALPPRSGSAERSESPEASAEPEPAGGPGLGGSALRLVSLSCLVPSSPSPASSEPPSQGWTEPEGPPPPPAPSPPLTAAAVAPDTPVPQGTVTPVAPGTKLVSSDVVRSDSSQTGLPPGVYRLVRHNGSKAVLIVKAAISTAAPPPPTPAPSPGHGKTCYGSLKSASPQPQEYRTPLQLFSADVCPSLPASSRVAMDRAVMARWQRMSEADKDVYRARAAKRTVRVNEPKGISLPETGPSGTEASSGTQRAHLYLGAPCFVDPSLPPGWRRQLVKRSRGARAGCYDVYIYTADGTKLRSTNQARGYLEEMGMSNIRADSINFSVSGPGPTMTRIIKRPKTSTSVTARKDDDLNELLEDSSDDDWIPGMMKN